MDIQDKKTTDEDKVETLTEVEMERRYDDFDKVVDLDISLQSNSIKYTTDEKEGKLCSFSDLRKKSMSDILDNKNLILNDGLKKELKIFESDLQDIWNNTGNKMYKLSYKNTNLPYEYNIEFNSDLIDDENIEKTHNISGDFIANNIKSQMKDYPLYKLDTMDVYGKKNNSNNWGVYKVTNINNLYNRFKKEKRQGFYYDRMLNISDHIISQFVNSVVLTLCIYITSSYIGLSVSPWLLLLSIFIILPYWKQNILFYHIFRLFISRIILVINSVWNKHYNIKKLFDTNQK
jgi:hypothetical protein